MGCRLEPAKLEPIDDTFKNATHCRTYHISLANDVIEWFIEIHKRTMYWSSVLEPTWSGGWAAAAAGRRISNAMPRIQSEGQVRFGKAIYLRRTICVGDA
jgi:hypothetical protein